MSKLAEFFKSKKLDIKFSRLGVGHRLNEPSFPHSGPSVSVIEPQQSSHEPSAGASKAAEAALGRMTQKNKKPDRPIQAMVRRELEQARRAEQDAEEVRERFTQKRLTVDKPNVLSQVLFWCPALFGQSLIGSWEMVDQAINAFLIEESTTNLPEAATLLLIRGLENSKSPVLPDLPLTEQPTPSEWREKRKQNFVRIVNNLLQSPDNATYRRLRTSNQLVHDLLSVDGSDMFFRACGFTRQAYPVVTQAPNSEGQSENPPSTETEPFLVISEDDARDPQHLRRMLDLLNTGEAISPQLYRDTKAFRIVGNFALTPSRDQLPDEYFCVCKEEVKRMLEQQQRIVEESGMLLTKTMRERLRVQEIRLFRYALIRVRIPGNYILQGTFYATDALGTVRTWITECLAFPTLEYQLWAPPGTAPAIRSNASLTARAELTNNSATLAELGLAPCSLINLSVQQTQAVPTDLLRPDLLDNATDL